MGMRSRLFALTAVGAVAVAGGVATAQSGTTQSKITASLSPNKSAKATVINFDVSTFNTAGGVPAPGTNAVVHLPRGMKVNIKGFTRCNGNLKNPPDGSACPAKSQIGHGSAVVLAQLGSTSLVEPTAVSVYGGAKQHGHDTLILYAVGTTPVSTQITLVGELIPGSKSPYSYKLNVPIPPIPTVPGGPNASIGDFHVFVGATVKVHGKKLSVITAPNKKDCVRGALHWGYDGTYQGSAPYSSATTSPCPKK